MLPVRCLNLQQKVPSVVDVGLPKGNSTYAVLDANVLLPPRLSDVLFDLYLSGIYIPRWTQDIEIEFERNWTQVKTGLKGSALKAYKASTDELKDTPQALKRLSAFRNAVGVEWEILGHDALKVRNQVPAKVDKGDIHVVAAAIQLKSVLLSDGSATDNVVIVSSNLKHLAIKDTAKLGIDVMHPGVFIDHMFATDCQRVEAALTKSLKDLKNPPYTQAELLDALALHGAKNTVKHFRKYWSL